MTDMKVSLATLTVAMAVSGAFAFDSGRWHQKRDAIMMEAERLRNAYRMCSENLETPAEDVVVPVETFPDGSVKLIVNARRAQYFLKEGLVWAEGVTVQKYKRDGGLDTVITARRCVVDRVSRSGWAEGRAQVRHDRTVLSGENVYFSSPEGYVKVFDKAKIDSSDLKLGGFRP